MKNFLASIALAALLPMGATAQPGWAKEWFQNLKLGGYIITEYQWDEGKDKNEFSTRLIRLNFQGTVAKEFDFRIQAQLNGMSNSSSGPRIVDAYMEWRRYDYLRIKAGQFKRAFTFDNPIHPIDEGFYAYASPVSKLAGFNDRNGCHASNGRDIGVQVQGDFAKVKGRNILHYQLAVYNGQGINTGDKDHRKDLMCEAWVTPVEGLRIGGSGWTGSYTREGTGTDADGEAISGKRTVGVNRYAISAEYATKNDWNLRGEYIHSQGKAFKSSTETDITINEDLGDKADGWYMGVIAPLKQKVFHAKARYSCYRSMATASSAQHQYEVGLDYIFWKRVKAQAAYIYVNDRSVDKKYSMIDCQLSVRF